MTKAKDLTREDLISICERAIVPVGEWSDRDTPSAQEKLGHAWVLLRAGCAWRPALSPVSTNQTIWIEITAPGFSTFDEGDGPEEHLFYLPTEERLARGGDWY